MASSDPYEPFLMVLFQYKGKSSDYSYTGSISSQSRGVKKSIVALTLDEPPL
jgi:hypothetical protein